MIETITPGGKAAMAQTERSFREKYGPWAVVAGASEGLGAAFADALAARGLNLVVVARRADPLRELTAALRARHGVEVEPVVTDLADYRASERIAAAAAQPRDVGLLIYNAAYAPQGPFLDLTAEDHSKVLAVNCRGPVLLAHALGKRMVARGRGGIVLMASLAGYQGARNLAHYAASKAFNLVLAEGLWDELRDQGIDVLACAAGATRTPGYEASPQPRRLIAPPVLEPAAVVAHALAELGRSPSTIPGFWNRAVGFLLHRLFTRRRAVVTMGASTRALGRTGP